MISMPKIHPALISVHDKTGLHEVAKFLAERAWQL
jgi:AICAR transformylase/IMP cyclohydrolase PurH